jgi:predicted tellurium resistance membrane protein TerC
MQGQLSDSDRLVFIILGMLLLGVLWPALPFAGVILVLNRLFKRDRKIIYAGAAVLGMVAVLFIARDIRGFVTEYLHQLGVMYRMYLLPQIYYPRL